MSTAFGRSGLIPLEHHPHFLGNPAMSLRHLSRLTIPVLVEVVTKNFLGEING
jgi:hypothetical protein